MQLQCGILGTLNLQVEGLRFFGLAGGGGGGVGGGGGRGLGTNESLGIEWLGCTTGLLKGRRNSAPKRTRT